MELNVWMSSTVSNAVQQEDGQWRVTIQRAEHIERTFHVHHIVSATGFGATSLGTIKPPEYPGQVGPAHCHLTFFHLTSAKRTSSKDKSYTPSITKRRPTMGRGTGRARSNNDDLFPSMVGRLFVMEGV